jgi:hypothetical protein
MFRFEELRVWHKAVELYDDLCNRADEIARMLTALKRPRKTAGH